VLKEGETDAPDGVKKASRQGNLLKDIFTFAIMIRKMGTGKTKKENNYEYEFWDKAMFSCDLAYPGYSSKFF